MKFFKKIVKWASILISLAIAFLFGAFYLLADEDNLRARMEHDLNGYQLRVLGGVGPSLNGPALAWHDLALKNPEGQEVLHIGKMLVSLALPEFFGPEQTVKIRLKDISSGGQDLGSITTYARRKSDGGIELLPLTGDLSGGKLSGRILLDGESFQPTAISLDVKGFDYGRLKQGMEGTIDAKAELTASAGTQWVQSIKGQAEIVGEKGVWPPGIDFWATDIVPKLLPFGDKVEDTRLNCMVARFNFNAGYAASPGILIDSERVTITGKGGIDLAQGRMDMRFSPRPKNPSFLSLATPVRVAGPLESPQIIPEPMGLAKKMGELMLGSINPALLLIPLTNTELGNKNPCVAALEKSQ